MAAGWGGGRVGMIQTLAGGENEPSPHLNPESLELSSMGDMSPAL